MGPRGDLWRKWFGVKDDSVQLLDEADIGVQAEETDSPDRGRGMKHTVRREPQATRVGVMYLGYHTLFRGLSKKDKRNKAFALRCHVLDTLVPVADRFLFPFFLSFFFWLLFLTLCALVVNQKRGCFFLSFEWYFSVSQFIATSKSKWKEVHILLVIYIANVSWIGLEVGGGRVKSLLLGSSYSTVFSAHSLGWTQTAPHTLNGHGELMSKLVSIWRNLIA